MHTGHAVSDCLLAGNLRRKLGIKPLTTLADQDARTGGDPGN